MKNNDCADLEHQVPDEPANFLFPFLFLKVMFSVVVWIFSGVKWLHMLKISTIFKHIGTACEISIFVSVIRLFKLALHL